jgi:tRNA threonylcarbamoyl adenosine modification protein YeaZ
VITLALETSTPRGSVAVHDGAALLFCEGFISERGHSSLLFPLLQAALARVPRVEQIAVGLGPGSYAGVRIAIATAMGLELSLGVPLVGVPSVAALAGESEYVAVGDARRETWYWTKVARGVCLEGPLLLDDAEFRARLAATDWPILATEPLAGLPAAIAFPTAETIGALAAQGRGITATAALEPIYLREPHITKPKAR